MTAAATVAHNQVPVIAATRNQAIPTENEEDKKLKRVGHAATPFGRLGLGSRCHLPIVPSGRMKYRE